MSDYVSLDLDLLRDQRFSDGDKLAYAALVLHFRAMDQPATIRELARLLNVTLPAVRHRLDHLIRLQLVSPRHAGYVVRPGGVRKCAFRYMPLAYRAPKDSPSRPRRCRRPAPSSAQPVPPAPQSSTDSPSLPLSTPSPEPCLRTRDL